MANHTSLREFLDTHKAEGVWTHTSLAGGKYFIGEDDMDKFYALYSESIMDQEKQYLTEKCLDIGPLRIDFDFIYDKEVTTHRHTKEQVCNFVKAYMGMVREYVDAPPDVDVYIMEKRKPTFDSKRSRMKSGIHIVVPSVCTHKFVEQRVRRALVRRMDEFFPNLPLQEPWEKVYDEGVVNRTVPWTLYGSRKNDPNSLPYLVSYIVKYENGNVAVNSDIPNVSPDLMRLLSLRRSDAQETPMTEEGKKLYSGVRDTGPDVRISGGRAVTPARGRPATRGDKPGSRGSSPMGRLMQPLEADKKEYLKAHVMNLNPTRAENYKEWVEVGICLHNIHPDLLDVFLDFSSQNETKYNEADCISKWNMLTFRNDGERTGEGTLRFWSRTDDPDEYVRIEESNVERLINAAASGTEHDVACVIYSKFRDQYKCADFGKCVWYRWTGHIWRETDRGVDLQLKLSKVIAMEFLKKVSRISDEMVQRGLSSCAGGGNKDCGICEYCKLEIERVAFNRTYMSLKTTRFKDNVMKECREVFFDENFAKNLDANKDLIAFNNGILDLTTMEFRDGKPEDCISFSTGIDYDPDRQYYEYPEWIKVDSFIKQVLPDPEVRDYFMKHLATTMIGGNTAQKFHVMTGSGSNGKSMIMNLLSKALGDYACVVPISLFTQRRGKSASAAPEVIRLKGRRFVTMQEPDEAISLNTGLMKEITSCEKMYARDLFKSGCEFEVQAKFHLACNEKPKINTTDGGTWRRLVVINFISKFVSSPSSPNEFPLDESIQFLVNSTEWATPFASFLIHLLKTHNNLRKITPPPKVMEYTSEYRNENDSIARFIAEKTVPWAEGEEIQQTDKPTLRRVFKQWKDENEQRMLSPMDLEKRLEIVYGKYPRGGWSSFKLIGG